MCDVPRNFSISYHPNEGPTRRYDHHRLSPLVSTRNDEGPLRFHNFGKSRELCSVL